MTRIEPRLKARLDPRMRATVVSRRPLAPLVLPGVHDAPAHVRAASGITRHGGVLWVVQDDTNVMVRIRGSHIDGVALPAGEDGNRSFDDGRGNKHLKMDLEGVFTVGPAIWALGSGSLGRREVVVRLIPGTNAVEVREAADWYATLRAVPAFCGSELNLEGAARHGDELVLAQRGNGVAGGDLAPVNALGFVPWTEWRRWWGGGEPPPLGRVLPVDLGTVEGVRLTFTDVVSDGEVLRFLAAAEASPDATRDGPVMGVAVGILDDAGARYALLRDAQGELWREKAEGLTMAGSGHAWIVTDADDPVTPAALLQVALTE